MDTRKNIFIAGAGSFGRNLIEKMAARGHQIMVADMNGDRLDAILPYAHSAVIGDCTKEKFLKSLGINEFDICIVALGENFRASLVVTAMLKELGAKKVISYATREMQEKFLKRNGADEVVYPNRLVAEWLSIKALSRNILSYTDIDSEYGVYEIKIPEKWINKTVAEVDSRGRYGINILGVRENDRIEMNVRPDTLLKNGNTMLILGKYDSIERVLKAENKKSIFG